MRDYELLGVICPYCGQPAEWVENKEIYGKNFGTSYMVYLCRPCKAYVGCHLNSKKPLGTLANKELREWRKRVHALIDPLWKEGRMSRGAMYETLSSNLGYPFHVGESDIKKCKDAIEIAKYIFKIEEK